MTSLPGNEWMDALASNLEDELVHHGVLIGKDALRRRIEQFAPATVEPFQAVAPVKGGEAEQMIAWMGDPNAKEDHFDEVLKFWQEGGSLADFKDAVALAMLHSGQPLRHAPAPSVADSPEQRSLGNNDETSRLPGGADPTSLLTSAERLHLAISVMLKDWKDGDFVLPRLAEIHMEAVHEKYLEVGKALAFGEASFKALQETIAAVPSAAATPCGHMQLSHRLYLRAYQVICQARVMFEASPILQDDPDSMKAIRVMSDSAKAVLEELPNPITSAALPSVANPAQARDGERLDWLEKHGGAIELGYWAEHMPNAGQLIVRLYQMDHENTPDLNEICTASNIRSAIDKAMSATSTPASGGPEGER